MSFFSIVRSRLMRNSVVSRNDRSPSTMSWNCRSPASVVRTPFAPATRIFMSRRSRVSRSSTANCLNICADSGFRYNSASFSNVLYASTVYCNRRLSCSSVRALFASTTAIRSLYLRNLDDDVTNQFRLTRQSIRRFQFLVRLVRRRRRQHAPDARRDLDAARATRSVAPADVTDRHSQLERAREQRPALRKLSRFPLILERHSRHGLRILVHGVPCTNCGPEAPIRRGGSREHGRFRQARRTLPECSSGARDDAAPSA